MKIKVINKGDTEIIMMKKGIKITNPITKATTNTIIIKMKRDQTINGPKMIKTLKMATSINLITIPEIIIITTTATIIIIITIIRKIIIKIITTIAIETITMITKIIMTMILLIIIIIIIEYIKGNIREITNKNMMEKEINSKNRDSKIIILIL